MRTKMWGTADPASPGPFAVTVEKDVGPENGAPDKLHDNMRPHFNVYRPTDMSQGYCHPVITWGNGTNDQPEPNPPARSNGCGNYKVLVISSPRTASSWWPRSARKPCRRWRGVPFPK